MEKQEDVQVDKDRMGQSAGELVESEYGCRYRNIAV